MKIITKSAQQTQQFAEKLSQEYVNGGVIALSGTLGSGKTTFAQGFAQGLGIKTRMISPTFIIIREYNLPFTKLGKLYHIDLYRLPEINEHEKLGLTEIFANPANIVLIEWPEKLGRWLPTNIIAIHLKIMAENQRELEVLKSYRA